MNRITSRQLHRVGTALRKAGIRCRDDLNRYDKASGLLDIKGIGPKSIEVVKHLRQEQSSEWTYFTNLPEHCEQPAVLPQDSPEV